jgi:hypothetical protein
MAAANTPVLAVTVTAAATLPQARFATLAGAVPAANAGGLGVARVTATTGQRVTLDVVGTTIIEASAGIALGAAVATTNNGRAVTHSTGVIAGYALQQAVGEGDMIEVLLK